jgi:hypothetical protein
VRVLRVDDSLIEESVSSSGSTSNVARRLVDARNAQFLEHSLGASTSFLELAPYLLIGNGGQAPTPLPSPAGYPLGGVGLPGWEVSTRVYDWEQVTVPAGTFRALRIEASGRRSGNFSSRATVTGRFRVVVWYAPDVKRYVKLQHQIWSADRIAETQIGEDLVELVSYNPAP